MDTVTDDLFHDAEALYEFGQNLGMYQVSMFLDKLAEDCPQEQVESGFYDGVVDTSCTATEGMHLGNDTIERDDFNPKVTFNDAAVADLHQVANTIRAEGQGVGIDVALQGVRDWYDGLSLGLGQHYYEGIIWAHDQAMAAFGAAAPDPVWEPFDPPEDEEDEE